MLSKLKEGFKGNVMTGEPIVCKIPLTFQRLVLNFIPKFRYVFFPKEGCSTVIKWVKYHNKLIKPLWFPQLLSTSTSQRSNYCPLSRRRGLSVHVLCLENIHKHGKEAKPTTRTLEYNSVICAIKWMTLSVMMSTWLPLIDSTRVIYILPSTNLLTYFFHHNFRCGCWNWH